MTSMSVVELVVVLNVIQTLCWSYNVFVIDMFRLEEVANVALRVPSILVLDLLYKCDIEGLTENIKAKNEDMLFKYKYVIWNMYYLGKYACVPRMICSFIK